MRILVTGATGFIGKEFVKSLSKTGHQIIILSRRPAYLVTPRKNISCIQADLRDPINPSGLKGVEIVYHLAAELQEPGKMRTVQIEGTTNLLKAAQKAGVRKWIQLSSIGVYGSRRGTEISEETKPSPANEYEKTKFASDQLVAESCREAGIQYATLRPSNILGQGMGNQSFFALIDAVRRRRFIHIGPRGALATYVHVEDVARALVSCEKAPNGSIYNLSSDCTWEVLIERIASLVGVRSPRLRIPALPLRLVIRALEGHMRLPLNSSRLASLTNRSRYSSDRIIHELGFSFAKPMPDGIEDVVRASL